MFVNPYSGKKRAPKIYKDKVLPLLELADISVHTIGKYRPVGSLKVKTLPWSLSFKSSRVNNTGDFLPYSRGRISAPFPIENSHIFPNTMSVFPN